MTDPLPGPRHAALRVSGELMRDHLFRDSPPGMWFRTTRGIPADAESVRAWYDPERDEFVFVYAHPSFPVVYPGDVVGRLDPPMYSRLDVSDDDLALLTEMGAGPFAGILRGVPRTVAEVRAARAEVARLSAILRDGIEESVANAPMEFEDGGVSIEHWAVRHLVRSFAASVGDAPNYVETVATTEDGRQFVATVRRREGKTPHQLKKDAEAERDALRAEADKLRAAIVEHHAQKADDRCIEDDDRLYAAAGLPPCDRRVGDKAAMLKNCERFINNRCEGGGWPTYAALEAENARLRAALAAVPEFERLRRLTRDLLDPPPAGGPPFDVYERFPHPDTGLPDGVP